MKEFLNLGRNDLRLLRVDQTRSANKNARGFFGLSFIAMPLVFCAACMAPEEKSFRDEAGPVHREGGEMRSVLFLSGKPSPGESLFSAFAEPEQARKMLSEDLAMISRAGQIKVRAVGWTDDTECSGEACAVLALRRASLVTEWLREHGASEERIASPRAGGKYFGDAYRPSDAERTVARRVDMEVVM